MIVRWIESIAQLRAVTSAWNALWARSEVTLPTARAEFIASWCAHFARQDSFRAMVVEQQGNFLAALPLLAHRKLGIRTFVLPGNAWSPAGDLLVEPGSAGQEALAQLLGELRGRGSLLCLNYVPVDSPRWQTLLAQVERQSLSMIRRPRMQIGLVRIDGDAESYFRSRSSNHRRYVRKALKRAAQAGQLELETHAAFAPGQIEPLLQDCFQIEASGWKGGGGTAVLNNPAVWNFYRTQAEQLAACGQLRLTRLLLDGRPIAFEYGWQSKGVYCSLKVGYDESVSGLVPGQLLRHLEIERFHRTGDVHWFDFLGASIPALTRWATHAYRVDRVVVGLDRLVGPASIAGYRAAVRLRHTLGPHSVAPPLDMPLGIQPLPAIDTPLPEVVAAL